MAEVAVTAAVETAAAGPGPGIATSQTRPAPHSGDLRKIVGQNDTM